jgi:hypothetical protein
MAIWGVTLHVVKKSKNGINYRLVGQLEVMKMSTNAAQKVDWPSPALIVPPVPRSGRYIV